MTRPDGVDLQLHRAGAAAQHAVVVPLDPGAADADAGQLQQRVAVHVALGRRRDIADDMRQVLGLGVEARGADIDQDAGQVGRVHLDPRHLLPGQELAHDDGHEAAAAAHLALDAGALVVGQRHDAGEGLERRGDVGGLLGDQQGAPVQPVAGDDLALAVQHAAARRRDQPGREAVLLGQRRVALALLDLQPVQPRAEEAEPPSCSPPEQPGRGG